MNSSSIGTRLNLLNLLLLLALCAAGGAGIYGVVGLERMLALVMGPAWETADSAMETEIGVQGEMLARAFETIVDFVGDRAYAANLIAAESAAHATYDVPPDLFVQFFRVVADTLRDCLAADWTDDTDRAWRALIADMSACAAEHEGAVA